ncbi:Hit1p Ecym_3166 [Eremothecium cymbalariae DBVPG|uniref:HIT-type domain-containing protein n=1 Tax=Eremothecium cymbalariae (strain CBS 270.75 / DBVPG 7215 / KCTC 17166 / NRRL Y-17582) TaxID=931890 RepID=G8JR99_ERECY|nr:Hypothetical protein Ecym_3166 [Eremothecium cymbalariae DBVPG\
MKCGICHENEAQYRCPKCSIRYCSLPCYKDKERHKHDELEVSKDIVVEKNTNGKKEPAALATPHFNEMLQNNSRLRELLQHNTVKFHLHQVYRILMTGVGATSAENDLQMSQEIKERLAVDYLNTLRYGGIHHNEAVEEFCEMCIEMLLAVDGDSEAKAS